MLKQVNRISKRILKTVKVDSFSKYILGSMNNYLNLKNTEIEVTNNQLRIKYQNEELTISLEKNCISYQIQNDNSVFSGKYVMHKNVYFIKFDEEEKTSYDLEKQYSHNIKHKEEFRVFNKDGIEIFKRKKEKHDNYYEDKETGKITLHEPDIFENYTETNYIWRVDDKYVIKRNMKDYIYPNGTSAFIDIRNSDDCFIRYQLIDSNVKEIPDCGEFYGIDKEIFFNYFQKKSTIDDVVNNFYSKKYYRPGVIEF